MLEHFNGFVLFSDKRSIKMSQLQLCAYNIFQFILCFREGMDIGSDTLLGYGMNLLLLAHTHTRHFFHCLIFSLLRSLEKILLTLVVLDQALREMINIIQFLSTVKKKKKVSESYKNLNDFCLRRKYLLAPCLKQENFMDKSLMD